ncbi:AP-3 complex subunit beta-1 [Rhizoclosmatium sp. JEL0117]|nr:AP-3 complex subunit beta-1 [Rhizoclosmatium sp. JEL0117]
MMDQLFEKAASLASAATEAGKGLSQDFTMGNLYETCEERTEDIRYLLDSKFEQEKINALKRLIAMISKGKVVRGYFPDVVKNVASSSFEVRKLVYIYLLRYAEEEPDLALLSINTFQRDLTDRNPMIRAMALRVMSSIRVPVIAPLIMMALKKGSVDMSPYVKKATANAIPKLYSLDPNMAEGCMELLEFLMNDPSTLVLGSAILTMSDICPDRLDLIHGQYRKLCALLLEADEWAQIQMLDVLMRYARTFFVDPNGVGKTENGEDVVSASTNDDFYAKKDVLAVTQGLDPDHALLLHSCTPLLQSRNAAVVLAVSRLFIHCAPPTLLKKPITSLIRLLTVTSAEHQYYTLQNLLTLAYMHPTLLQPYTSRFFLFKDDADCVKDLKLEILGAVVGEANASVVVRELKDLVRSWDTRVAVKAIKLMGVVCSKAGEAVAGECLGVLMGLLASDQETIVAESVIVTRRLLQQRTTSSEKSQNTNLIILLARSLDGIQAPMARASILWLIGQHCQSVPKIAADTFRKAVKGFCTESAIVKLQILTLGAKLISVVRAPKAEGEEPWTSVEEKANKTVELIFEHLLNVARYDMSYDVRDRARLVKALVDSNTAPGLFEGKLKFVLLTPKPAPTIEMGTKGQNKYTLGSLSHSFNVSVKGYKPLPEWSPVIQGTMQRNIPSALASTTTWSAPARSVNVRADSVKAPTQQSVSSAIGHMRAPIVAPTAVPAKKKYADLSAFLDDSSSDEEEVEEEEEEEEVEEDEAVQVAEDSEYEEVEVEVTDDEA